MTWAMWVRQVRKHLGYEVLHNPPDDMRNTTSGDLCVCAGTIVVQILVGG